VTLAFIAPYKCSYLLTYLFIYLLWFCWLNEASVSGRVLFVFFLTCWYFLFRCTVRLEKFRRPGGNTVGIPGLVWPQQYVIVLLWFLTNVRQSSLALNEPGEHSCLLKLPSVCSLVSAPSLYYVMRRSFPHLCRKPSCSLRRRTSGYLPAATDRHCPLASTKIHCLVAECVNDMPRVAARKRI